MAYTHSPQIILDGLVLAMDAASQTSFRGIPTTNLIAGAGLSIYNNVPGDVSSVLVPTSETYKGATVWKQTLTPINSTGVSYLSNGNNPGIGTVIWGAGGGLANRYTGHSIFFKPTVPMHSSPIFTQYSNIPGYQSSNLYDDMGDGWFRANVIWYDTVTRSDGKFWAINPQTATIGTPIDIYWAGPFKEDRNDSLVVAPFVNGTRGTTAATGGGWVDRSGNGNNGELVNGVGFNSSNLGGLVFDGVDDYIQLPSNSSLNFGSGDFTVLVWVGGISSYPGSAKTIIRKGSRFDGNIPGWGIMWAGSPQDIYFIVSSSSGRLEGRCLPNGSLNGWSGYKMLGMQRVGTNWNQLVDTSITNLGNFSGDVSGTSDVHIGYNSVYNTYLSNNISQVQIYNRALSPQEIIQNYNATKGRYGL